MITITLVLFLFFAVVEIFYFSVIPITKLSHDYSYQTNRLNPSEKSPRILSLSTNKITSHSWFDKKNENKQAIVDLISSISSYETNRSYSNTKLSGPFADLNIQLHIESKYVHLSSRPGGEDKYFVGPDYIKEIGKQYIVYSAGTAGYIDFEKYMASLGSSVYAFDCTDRKRVEWTEFSFYPWCIGQQPEQILSSAYHVNTNIKPKHFLFYSLFAIMNKLHHHKVDMLKMDIEGYEWNLLYSEIINYDKNNTLSLPNQLLFELHTQ
eukprot:gene17193-23691_t